MTELARFDLGTTDIKGVEGYNGNDADADAHVEEDSSDTDNGSMQNVEGLVHSWFDLWTRDVNWYECDNGNNGNTDQKDDELQAND